MTAGSIIVIVALLVFAIGELALIIFLLDQLNRMNEDPYDREWMDYKKWRQSRK